MLIANLPQDIQDEAVEENKRQRELGYVGQSKMKHPELSYSFHFHKSAKGYDYWNGINKEKPKIHKPLSEKPPVAYW